MTAAILSTEIGLSEAKISASMMLRISSTCIPLQAIVKIVLSAE